MVKNRRQDMLYVDRFSFIDEALGTEMFCFSCIALNPICLYCYVIQASWRGRRIWKLAI